MDVRFEGKRMVVQNGIDQLWVEPWGPDAFRVRMTAEAEMDKNDWALSEPVPETDVEIKDTEVDTTDPWYRGDEHPEYHFIGHEYTMTNGKITAVLNPEGWLSFRNQKGEALLTEFWRNRDRMNRYCVPLAVSARVLKPVPSTSDYELYARFEAVDGEKIFGMGQYQMAQFDKKGTILELEHKNSQASVPFYVSSLGYGFLWNNPGVGTATFGMNKTEWHLPSTKKMDYYITAGDTPAEIEFKYSAVTGRTPMMPEYGLGFWQCKLRYRNQQEVLEVAREHKRRGLPLDVIVVDFFHWTLQGEWKFDPECFPDPAAMVKELKDMGIETVVSVWPTVDERSCNYNYMKDHGYLMRSDRGTPYTGTNWMGPVVYFDATHPGARKFIFDECKKNYMPYGIHMFWLDEAEPEVVPYEYDSFRYYAGPGLQVTNIYPKEYAHAFYDGLKESGEKEVLSLIRSAWAGSQKYATLTWSGDILSSWRTMKEQLQAGLSMGMAGIPWWTCDLGGFLGGDPTDEGFRELLARWFAWGCFLPVFRMHGERVPWYKVEPVFKENGRQVLSSGQPNEMWSFGDRMYDIMTPYLFIRENLRDYVRDTMREASENGSPVIRPLFYAFPDDQKAWEVYDAHMFGNDILVAPVTEPGVSTWPVYLPAGTNWIESATGKVYEGGQTVEAFAKIETCAIPVFIREGSGVKVY